MYPSALGLGLVTLLAVLPAHAQTYTATYSPDNLPNHSENGQAGTNKCGTGSNQTSLCQNAYSSSASCCLNRSHPLTLSGPPVNSVEDFCLFAPPKPGPASVVGNVEVRNNLYLYIDDPVSPDPSHLAYPFRKSWSRGAPWSVALVKSPPPR